jgi:hypothetical protein
VQQFNVDDDLAELVERLAKKRPFENLSFNDALRRVLQSHLASVAPGEKRDELEELLAEARASAPKEPKKAPSPSPTEWVAIVPELKARKNLNTWKAVCDLLKIDTAGDSARRKLKNWVKANRPAWPAVPDID